MKTGNRRLLVIVSLICMLVLAACGEKSNGNKNDSTSSDGEKSNGKVTILVDNSTRVVEAIAEGVKEKYNIDTEIEIRPSGGDGDNIVKTRLSTGEMTDIFYYNTGSLFKALNPEQHLEDLSQESYMSNIQDTYKEAVSVGDSIYGVPATSAFAGGILYNKKVYDELGLTVPQSWEQLLENNEKIKDAGKVPVIASYQETWTSQVILLADYYNLYQADHDFAEKYTKNQAKYADTPAALRGFEKIYELHEKGHYNESPSSVSYDKALEMLATGEGVHYPILTEVLAAIEENYPEYIDDIGFFPVPGDDEKDLGMTLWLSHAFYVNKDAEDMDAAKKWVEYAASPEAMEKLTETMKPYGPFMIDGVELPEDSYEALKDMLVYIEEGKVTSALEFSSPLKGPNLEQITVETGLGMTTPKEAAEKYDRDVEKQAQQLKLEGW